MNMAMGIKCYKLDKPKELLIHYTRHRHNWSKIKPTWLFSFKLNYSMYTTSTQNFPVLCKSGTVFVQSLFSWARQRVQPTVAMLRHAPRIAWVTERHCAVWVLSADPSDVWSYAYLFADKCSSIFSSLHFLIMLITVAKAKKIKQNHSKIWLKIICCK